MNIDDRLQRIEALLERIAISTELNTWQQSLENTFEEFPTKQIVPILHEAMKQHKDNPDRSRGLRSQTLKNIRKSVNK